MSTTSIANISPSSFCGSIAVAPDAASKGGFVLVAGSEASAIERQCLTLRHEARDAALPFLHSIADLGRVLR